MTTTPDRAAGTIVVRGRVQGVGFRMYAYHKALECGVVGTVRNASDGKTVIAHVEGTPRAIECFFEALKIGPPRAIVEDATIEWCAPTGGFLDFRIVA